MTIFLSKGDEFIPANSIAKTRVFVLFVCAWDKKITLPLCDVWKIKRLARGIEVAVVRSQSEATDVSSNTTIPTLSIASEILAYLIQRPAAKDTLEGIVEWWFLEQEIQRRTTEVKDALATLVGQGFVIERKGRDGRLFYHLNQRKRQEIHALLPPVSNRGK